MLEKCLVKSYPDYFLNEDSFSNFENLKPTIDNKKSLNANSKRYSENIFKKENLIINEDTIISGFHLNLKKSCKLPKHKYANNIMSLRNHLKPTYNIPNERVINKNQNRNKIISFNRTIGKDDHLVQTDEKWQRRALIPFKNQLDIQKSINFNIISYSPEDYNSNLNKIQIFHKLDKGGSYFPRNRIQTPLSSRHLTEKREKNILSHRIPTLKFQSFYGCFNGEKPNKFKNRAKSNSKNKNNHLEKYNLDKLIEIGDNYENKMIPILSFGKKVKNIKKKIKLKNSLIKNNSELIKNMKKLNNIRDIDNKIQNNIINENKDKMEISHIKEIEIPNNGTVDNLNNIKTENNKKKLNAKNFVYHGQIKRKRNIINNVKIFISAKNSQMFNMNTNNNNNSNSISYKKYKIYQNNKIKKNFKDNNLNKNCSSLTKLKKIKIKSNNFGLKQREDKYDENQSKIVQGITPKNYKRKMELSLNSNENNNSLSNKNSNYNNLKNFMERNKSLNNYIIINGNSENPELIVKTEKPKKILLTENEIMNNKFRGKKSNNFYTNTNINSPVLQNRANIKISDGHNGKKYIKNGNIINININGINNNIQVNNKISKNISSKPKLYYGYDEYNVDNNIIKHSYLESVYSRKKNNLKNASNGNIN